MSRAKAFTLVELLVVVAIIAILIAILLPVVSKARASALGVQCASNLRQVDAALTSYINTYKKLPEREAPLDIANPHVFRYKAWTQSIAEVMEKYSGSRKVLYCPANSLQRTPEDWWPYKSGSIAGTYQYPFWLNELLWVIPKPDYKRLRAQQVLAADYLGVSLKSDGNIEIVAWNHERVADGSPRGMNMLFGDHHVEWHPTQNNWQVYGYGFENIYWYYGKK